MSVFTTVTADELRRWLQGYDAGELLDLQGISAGIENTNYFVTTSGGRYVLTLFEKLTAQELPFYLNLMAHLAERGVPSAHPVANRGGSYLGTLNGKPAALVARLEGADVSTPSADQCAAIGAVLARLHLAGQSYPAKMDNPRGPKWWKGALPEILPFLPDTEATLLQAEIRFQSLYRFSDLPRGAIHADLFRDNVMFDGDRLCGFFDFYFAGNDSWLFDLAVTLNDWCIFHGDEAADGLHDERRAHAMLASYQSVRPLTAAERQLLPAMLRAGALRFWLSRLWDWHLPREAAMLKPHDPGHFERVLRERVRQARDLADSLRDAGGVPA